MLPKADVACSNCGGYGIKWNESFDKRIDQISDTQGLSFYDAVNQAKADPSYKNDYWPCKKCDGTGTK